MHFNQIEYFLEVAKCKSITKASETLYISKTALSESISRMEKELGFKVFERSNHGVELTEAGEKFFADAWQISKMVKSWNNLRTSNSEIAKEQINMLISNTLINSIFKKIFLNLTRLYPDLVILANGGSGSNFIAEYQTNKTSINVIIVPEPSQRDFRDFCAKNSLQIYVLKKDQFLAVMNKENALSGKTTLKITDLQNYPLVVQSKRSNKSPLIKYLQETLKEISFATPNQSIILEMLENNQAVSVFPSLIAKSFSENRKLSCIPIEDFKLTVEHWLVCPIESYLTPGEKKIVNYIQNYYLNLI